MVSFGQPCPRVGFAPDDDDLFRPRVYASCSRPLHVLDSTDHKQLKWQLKQLKISIAAFAISKKPHRKIFELVFDEFHHEIN